MITSIRRTPIAKALAMLLLAVGVFALTPSVANAAPACEVGNYGSSMTLTAQPPQGRPGDTILITGTGYPPNCELSVFVNGIDIGRVVTDANGTFTIKWTIPADFPLGGARVTTSVGGVTKTAIVDVVSATPVTAPAGTPGKRPTATRPGTSTLPRTGSDVLPLVAGGVALLVVGSLVILSSRKRSANQL